MKFGWGNELRKREEDEMTKRHRLNYSFESPSFSPSVWEMSSIYIYILDLLYNYIRNNLIRRFVRIKNKLYIYIWV